MRIKARYVSTAEAFDGDPFDVPNWLPLVVGMYMTGVRSAVDEDGTGLVQAKLRAFAREIFMVVVT